MSAKKSLGFLWEHRCEIGQFIIGVNKWPVLGFESLVVVVEDVYIAVHSINE